VSQLGENLQEALLLLLRRGALARSTGRREHHAGWRFVRPGTADALERRGLVSVQYDTVRLTEAGRLKAEALEEERARECARRECERLTARAAGFPPAPVFRLVGGDGLGPPFKGSRQDRVRPTQRRDQ
jgi:hypothetical protein